MIQTANHSPPCVTWFNGCQDSTGSLEHRLIDVPLVFGELPIGREGACDVGGVAVVLPAHVKQTVDKKFLKNGISSPLSYIVTKVGIVGDVTFDFPVSS